MNEYLEQLVRVLTNTYSRSQKMFGERVSPGSTNQRSFPCLPCCWGAIANKQHLLIHLTDYALSLSLSACFLRTRFVMSFAKDKGQLQTPRPYSLCFQHIRQTSEPKSSKILTGGPSFWPICSSVQGGFPGYDVRTSAWQHVFRGCFRSYSATASLQHVMQICRIL